MSTPRVTERDFLIRSPTSAPEVSQDTLNWYVETFGMVPNLAGILAESPARLISYWQLQNSLLARSALSPQEINVVQTSVVQANACQYAPPGIPHTKRRSPVMDNERHVGQTKGRNERVKVRCVVFEGVGDVRLGTVTHAD